MGTPDTVGFPIAGDDILAPGVGSPAAVIFGGLGANVNAFSFSGPDAGAWQFSVGPSGAGLPGTGVAAQMGEHAHDIFVTPSDGTNALFFDGNGMGPPPIASPLGLAEGVPFVSGGVDGIDFNSAVPGGAIYWSVDAAFYGAGATPAYLVPGASEVAVFMGSPLDFAIAPAVFADSFDLGILSGGTDLDALYVIDRGVIGVFEGSDEIYFSLTPSSAALLPVVGDFGLLGADPGDIFLSTPGAGPFIYATDVDLGLVDGSNLTGLSFVPEAAEASLFALGLLGLAANRRRKRVAGA